MLKDSGFTKQQNKRTLKRSVLLHSSSGCLLVCAKGHNSNIILHGRDDRSKALVFADGGGDCFAAILVLHFLADRCELRGKTRGKGMSKTRSLRCCLSIFLLAHFSVSVPLSLSVSLSLSLCLCLSVSLSLSLSFCFSFFPMSHSPRQEMQHQT